MKITIGICAYNEEKNIGKVLKDLKFQKLDKDFEIKKIEVVASGCQDNTVNVVKEFKDIGLIIERNRTGKSTAMNYLIKNSHSDIIVFQCADIVLENKDTLNKLLLPFKNKDIGAVGGRPIPLIDWKNPIGFINHLIWNLHHRINMLNNIKIGEFCAFRRKLIEEMPYDTVNDEAYLQYLVEKKGQKLAYSHEAIVYNKVPLTLFDLIKQRKRVHYGHIQLEKRYNYTVPTMKIENVLFTLFFRRSGKLSFMKIVYTIFAIFVEALARFLANVDWIRGKTPYKWDKYA